MYKVNLYSNITKPTVTNSINVLSWFSKIKSSTRSEAIKSARQNNSTKKLKSDLPCITFNFLFDGYKKDSNIISSTGLLYIDIDTPNFDISCLDTSKVFAYYRSISGKGWAIIVRVEGLTKENFKPTYISVCEELGIIESIDTNVIKPTQFSVLSFDPEIFYNPDSYVFAPTPIDERRILPLLPLMREREEETYKKGVGAKSVIDEFISSVEENNKQIRKSRFNNKDEFEFNGEEFIFDFDKGFEIVQTYVKDGKYSDNSKNDFLIGYVKNRCYLDPSLSKHDLYNIANYYSKKLCYNPAGPDHLHRVVNSIWKEKEAGTLKPITTNKKILFNPESTLSVDQKKKIAYSVCNTVSSNAAQDRIYKFIQDYNFNEGKITQRLLIKHKVGAKKTIEKHWHLVKDWVTERNHSFMASNKAVGSMKAPQDKQSPAKEKLAPDEPLMIVDKPMKLTDRFNEMKLEDLIKELRAA
ncbi:BT4734/BF3469 family protein [uncultured Imperialibacter sp.]|uniref:BT4734/BF3469 family protein n=1 Tax=uncultured Imperialibacter sp. TaxID=1672639 RepID=UPI0030DA1917